MGILRLLLAIAVIIDHTAPLFGIQSVGGPVAVEAFFMISGFYMALVLNGKYGRGSYPLFISNRLLRLYPVYWVVLLVSIATSLLFYYRLGVPLKLEAYQHARAYLSAGDWALLAVSNLFIFGQDVLMFLGLSKGGHLYFTSHFQQSYPPLFTFLFVPQAWSLAIEIAFYLIAPFLVRRRPMVLLLLCGASLLIRLYLYRAGLYQDPWSYRFFPSELLFFLVGALAFRAYAWLEPHPLPTWLLYLSFAGVLAYTVFYQFLPHPVLRQVGYYACFAGALPLVFRLTKSSQWMNKVGELSYPVYISHILVLMVAPVLMSEMHFPAVYLSTWVVVVTVLFSMLLVRWVVEPVEIVRQRRARRASSPTAARAASPQSAA